MPKIFEFGADFNEEQQQTENSHCCCSSNLSEQGGQLVAASRPSSSNLRKEEDWKTRIASSTVMEMQPKIDLVGSSTFKFQTTTDRHSTKLIGDLKKFQPVGNIFTQQKQSLY